jgi:hypothetical protein
MAAYVSSAYRIGRIREARVSQTKSLEARTENHKQVGRLRGTYPSYFLPKNSKQTHQKSTGQRKGKKGKRGHRGGGSLGSSRFGAPSGTALSLKRIPLFPMKFRGSLRYADSGLTMTSSSGTVASYVFSCNGLYDPDITGTGHQPAGFDQMMLSYDHYTVTRARIGVTFLSQSGGVDPVVAINLRSNPTPVTVINQLLEDGLDVSDHVYAANVFGSIKTLSLACNIAKFGGVPNLLDAEEYRGSLTANPTEQSYFHVQCWNNSAETSVISMEVVIEYEAWFTEPRSLTQSLSSLLIKELVREETKVQQPSRGCLSRTQ